MNLNVQMHLADIESRSLQKYLVSNAPSAPG